MIVLIDSVACEIYEPTTAIFVLWGVQVSAIPPHCLGLGNNVIRGPKRATIVRTGDRMHRENANIAVLLRCLGGTGGTGGT